MSPDAGPATLRPDRGSRRRLAWVVALALATVAAAVAWRVGPWRHPGFVEYPMPTSTDIPTAVAVAADGTVWFTIEFSNSIGVLRNGAITKLPKGRQNLEPIGLAVDSHGFAWYTDAPARVIARIAPDGTITAFPLRGPVAKLARLTVGPDDAVWFAEATSLAVTRLKGGTFTRFEASSFSAAPFGVAVDREGTVWATLQNVNRLVRISRDGRLSELDVPTRGSVPSDITVDPTGAVWFAEIRGHALGRLHDGVMAEFPLPRSDARPFDVAVDAANNVWYTDLSGWLGRLSAERARVR